MKNIGILTYHSVCNYGANLQALATVNHFKNNGYNPIVIDWVPNEVSQQYKKTIPPIQYEEHQNFVNKYIPLTKRCRSDKEILKQIKDFSMSAVVIGSDAVTQHKSLWARISFPNRRIYTIAPSPPPQLVYPNPYWGSFLDYEKAIDIPTIMMSVSSQNEKYIGIRGATRTKIHETLKKFAYISVRDKWTQKMFRFISNGKIIPPITPDPVFYFNQSTGSLIPSQKDLFRRFNISNRYIILSFAKKRSVDESWLSEFVSIAKNNNIDCLMMPMPKGHIFTGVNGLKNLSIPISPLDWYGLIKYSFGYIGHNMHPIIVAIHNNVPFFSFDYYGIINFKYFVNSKSSKIYDILNKAGMTAQRFRDIGSHCIPPCPKTVMNLILNLRKQEHEQLKPTHNFALAYEEMMNEIFSVIERQG